MSLFGRKRRPPPSTPEPPAPPPSLPAIHSTPSLPELARTYGINIPPVTATSPAKGGKEPIQDVSERGRKYHYPPSLRNVNLDSKVSGETVRAQSDIGHGGIAAGRTSNVSYTSTPPLPATPGKSIAEMYARETFSKTFTARQTGYRPASFLYAPGTVPPRPTLPFVNGNGARSSKSRAVPRAQKAAQTFNLMVVGDSNTGKTSFLKTLLSTFGEQGFESNGITTVEVTEGGERIKLTVVDTEGLGMSAGKDELEVERRVGKVLREVEAKFEETLKQENQVYRSSSKPHDAFIHLCLYFINHTSIASRASLPPTNLNSSHHIQMNGKPASPITPIDQMSMSPLDLKIIKRLSSRVNVLPVVGRADELTEARLKEVKEAVRRDISTVGGWGVFKRPVEEDEAMEEEEEEEEEEKPRRKSKGRGRKKSLLKSVEGEEKENEEAAEGQEEVEGEEEEEEEEPKVIKVRSRSPFVSKSSPYIPKRKSLHFGGSPAWGISNGGVEEPSTPDVEDLLPFALISPENPWSEQEVEKFERKFRWGNVQVLNENHCDFEPLRRSVFGGYFKILKDSTRQEKYEPFRTQRLLARRATRNISVEQREELLKKLEMQNNGNIAAVGKTVSSPSFQSERAMALE